MANDALSAFLAFYDRALYPSYAVASRLFQISPLEDQALAGAMMWVFGSFVYLLPAVVITLRMLSPNSSLHSSSYDQPHAQVAFRTIAAEPLNGTEAGFV